MQLANVEVAQGSSGMRKLRPDEIREINTAIRVRGKFTAKEFKDAVRAAAKCTRDNLETMLMHPDAEQALIVDPVQVVVTGGHWATLFPLLSERVQKRARGRLWQGRKASLGELREAELKVGSTVAAFDEELKRLIEAVNTRRKKNESKLTEDAILEKEYRIPPMDGRAAYARMVMRKAFEEVLQGKHPIEQGNCLYRSEEIRERELHRRTEEQTNNHLVRHRLLILERVLGDVVKEYAGGDKKAVRRITIEVNRDLREMSGKTAKEIKQDLGLRRANHSGVVAKLEKALGEERFHLSTGLIRKARIAEDLGWRCPYTGKLFDPHDLLHKHVDKDHVIPRSQRPTDSLESLVITYNAVNTWKGNRTALQFIQKEGGKEVPGIPSLTIMPLARYQEFVEKLETFRGHSDDQRRKKKRKQLMLLENYEEKEFTPKDLTTTSQLVRLGAQKITKYFADLEKRPEVVSLPGAVTGAVRKGWNVLGCLGLANPEVLDEKGNVRTKTEIREITHLHHALDACVLAFAARFLPNPKNGRIWELMVKRRLSPEERPHLEKLQNFKVTQDGKFQLLDLEDKYKEQIRQRLAERRVVQHIPARMDGMECDETVYRLFNPNDESPTGRRIKKWFERLLERGELKKIKSLPDPDDAKTDLVLLVARKRRTGGNESGKALHDTGKGWRWIYLSAAKSSLHGLSPKTGIGKLRDLKAVKVLGENFGVAVVEAVNKETTFHMIRPRKVWEQLSELRKQNPACRLSLIRKGSSICLRENDSEKVLRVFGCGERPGRGLYFDVGNPDAPGREREIQLSAFATGRARLLPQTFCGAVI
jgi:CRISPR-associated endonuclease Csn1